MFRKLESRTFCPTALASLDPFKAGSSYFIQATPWKSDAGIQDAGGNPKADAGDSSPSDGGIEGTDAGDSIPNDGGPTSGCRVIEVFKAAQTQLGGGDSLFYSELKDSLSAPYHFLYLEEHAASGFPKTIQLDPSSTLEACDTCVVYFENCTEASCAKYYFAQAGMVDYLEASFSGAGGKLSANARNLKMVEWDFEKDVPLQGGACVEIGSVDFSDTW